MSAAAFDWDSVPTGEVHADGIDYRWKRGDVHIVFVSELQELLVFIDRLTLTFFYSAEALGFIAFLKGDAESAFIADHLEISNGVSGTLSIGSDVNAVEIGLTEQEVASVIEGLTVMQPHMEAVERAEMELADDEEQ